MEPISGFVRAVVGDDAFVFGKGMVSAFLLARSKDSSLGPVSRSVRPAVHPYWDSPRR